MSRSELRLYYKTALAEANPVFKGTVSGGQPPPHFAKLHCNVEWHAAHTDLLYAVSVYHIAKRVSKDSDRFEVSQDTIAEYLGADIKSIRPCYQFWIDQGFWEVIQQRPGRSTEYHILDHAEWAARHPGKCCEKLLHAEGDDQLSRDLHGITGKTFWPNYMTALRKTGFQDEQIKSYARTVLEEHRQLIKVGKQRSFHNMLIKHLRDRVQ
jgi:hypothetical protein